MYDLCHFDAPNHYPKIAIRMIRIVLITWLTWIMRLRSRDDQCINYQTRADSKRISFSILSLSKTSKIKCSLNSCVRFCLLKDKSVLFGLFDQKMKSDIELWPEVSRKFIDFTNRPKLYQSKHLPYAIFLIQNIKFKDPRVTWPQVTSFSWFSESFLKTNSMIESKSWN